MYAFVCAQPIDMHMCSTNLTLTQLDLVPYKKLKFGELEELEKIRTGKMDESERLIETEAAIHKLQTKLVETEAELKVTKLLSGNKGDDAEIIQDLQITLAETEAEVKEVTELKNAEIDVLRKQLNRAEHKKKESDSSTEKVWSKERESLREEIRRLNREVSSLKERAGERVSYKESEDENDNLTSRYQNSDSKSYTQELDDTDVSSLQSIISMMRQNIDQSNREKDLLEQRLAEEQGRSQMELKAFAKTLEGVDDLRQSAETMSREIRRIKVRGYRPTRSDLFGTGSLGGNGKSNFFGELTAAVEASENMEDAIQLIESQNDSMEERRRMNVVVAASAASSSAAESTAPKKESKYRGGLAPLEESREGGFLSFWNSAGGSGADSTEEEAKKEDKEKKKKKSKRKKRRDGGSVITSFF